MNRSPGSGSPRGPEQGCSSRARRRCCRNHRPSRALLEPLEARQLLAAAQVWVNDNWVIADDAAPAGLSAGDIVANTGAGDDGAVSDKTFGLDAFATLAAGIAAVAAAGTVHVLPGTYAESDLVLDKPLTIDGDAAGVNRDAVRVVPALVSSRAPGSTLFSAGVHSAFIIRSGNVTVRDLTIDGDGGVGGVNSRNYRGGIVYDYRPGAAYNNVTLSNCAVRNLYDVGIHLDGGYRARSTGHIVSGNEVRNVRGGANSTGILIIQASATITGNTITTCPTGLATNHFDGSAYAPKVIIQSNTMSNLPMGMQLSSLGDGSVIGGALPYQGNTISTNGSNGIGIHVNYAVGQVSVENNAIHSAGLDSAIWLFANTQPTKPVLIRNNSLAATNAASGYAGQGTGIFLTDDGELFDAGDAGTYATITGNTITGFVRGIDLFRVGEQTPGGKELRAAIGGNTITGSGAAASRGIRIFDANGPALADASASIDNDGGAFSGLGVDIEVTGGAAEIGGQLAGGAGWSLLASYAASVDLLDSQTFSSLAIQTTAQVRTAPGGGSVLYASGLAIDADARLDLAGNELIVQTADAAAAQEMLAMVTERIVSARNGNAPRAWDGGAGITSSTAGAAYLAGPAGAVKGIGAIQNIQPGSGEPLHTRFGGFEVDAHAVLLKYTWYGDNDLDGQLTGDDYFRMDSGYLAGQGTYGQGDVDYGGRIDGGDYFLMDLAFLTQSRAVPASPAPSEPFAAEPLAATPALAPFNTGRQVQEVDLPQWPIRMPGPGLDRLPALHQMLLMTSPAWLGGIGEEPNRLRDLLQKR